ncbi:NAD(P)-dependent oxidoreductase [Variovorax sp. PBS-H4]|uniref:NAD(P)-dependent oxidoreductase n=1 Tax=Variovorax sp. PBS-H4 TaxID=434008 RepID=UPI001E4C1883|nr:NAD(P)-dependent oxidoreductase [Variovorax sp. PBS-H4]
MWNRDSSRLAPLTDAGAVRISSVSQAFASSGVVLSVLANDAAFREVVLDSGVLAGAAEGLVHTNMATLSPDLVREAAAAHAAAGVGYVASPMFGPPPLAEAGALNIITAGAPAAVARVQPFLAAISAKVWPLGAIPEQANLVKVAGNLVVSSAIQVLSEAVSLAERGGIDARWLVDMLTSTIVPGPVYATVGERIATSRYTPVGFSAVGGRKDVDLARSAAAAYDLQLPFADPLSGMLTEVIDAGHGQQDWTQLAELQRRRFLSAL